LRTKEKKIAREGFVGKICVDIVEKFLLGTTPPSVASFDATRIMLKPLEILCLPINPDITVDVYELLCMHLREE